MMLTGIILDHFHIFSLWEGGMGDHFHGLRLIWYLIAVLPVGVGILKSTLNAWLHLDFFNEFSLMLLASVGAFLIGEYPEGVAVLLFYAVGEKLEDDASGKAKERIRSLLGRLPSAVSILSPGGKQVEVKPEEVKVGDIVVVKPGERVPVDGALASPSEADFNTAAITGESLPQSVAAGGAVISGSMPISQEVRVKAAKRYADSSMSRIMQMIEDAASRKSHSETLLRRITRWYTPAVMVAAALVFVVPWIVGLCNPAYDFEWHVWFKRMLVLLVCSCPCALVVSIPLSYFAAIGSASRLGVLFKGSRYLDAMRSIDTLLVDKTGTLTTGKFHVAEVVSSPGFTNKEVMAFAAALDSHSTHPLAQAIVAEAADSPAAADVVTLEHGITGTVEGHKVVVGSRTLLDRQGIAAPKAASDSSEVCVAVDGRYAGAIYLDDTLKPETAATMAELHKLGVKNIVVLSGDRESAVAKAAKAAGADAWHAQLLPEQKHEIVERLRAEGHKVAFVGDGINDAPSLAAADLGIAVGTGGTDVAMESADAVITGNSLSRLVDAMKLSRKVKRVVTENVSLAIGVKLLVMVLGVFGIATLWAAVFADTGITLITIIWTLISLYTLQALSPALSAPEPGLLSR